MTERLDGLQRSDGIHQDNGHVTKLRLALMHSGLPQYMVAAQSGMPPSRVSEYALGKKSIPAHHLMALASVLRVNPVDLIGDADYVDMSTGSLTFPVGREGE